MLECAVCHHPQRNDIDSALIGNKATTPLPSGSIRPLRASLVRHRNTGLPKNPLEAKAASDAQTASALVREIQQITKFTSKLLSRAVKEQDFELAAKVIKQLEAQLALKAACLEKPRETRNEAVGEAGKLRVVSGWSSVRAKGRDQQSRGSTATAPLLRGSLGLLGAPTIA